MWCCTHSSFILHNEHQSRCGYAAALKGIHKIVLQLVARKKVVAMDRIDIVVFCVVLHKRVDSENLLNGALAALEPKQRRQ